MRRRRTVYSLTGSLIAWEVATGLYMIVRFCGTGDTIDWIDSFWGMVGLWLVGGCLLGVMDWLVTTAIFGSRLRSFPFGVLTVLRVSVLLGGFLGVILISRCLSAMAGESGLSGILPSFWDRVDDPRTVGALVYLSVAASMITFIKQTSSLVGGRVLLNLATGKYRKPKTEERIFMFLDLRSSTSHAERLGNERFCRLVQDCFRDLTDAALRHSVEIYKYVGDEAILTWNLGDGLRGRNCLEVFFTFCDSIEKRRSYYVESYGVFPEFKAGVNVGSVTVLEIGVIKREIAYLSDVLNTAARIEGKCVEFGQQLIISEYLRVLFEERSGAREAFRFERLGAIDLRGRAEAVDLFGVERRVI